jgi:galactokinase
MKSFDDIFGEAPQASGDAPGRVNLLGEHTDYSEGFVLPTSIPQRTWVSVRRSPNPFCTVHSADLQSTERFSLDELPDASFARYLYGCLRVLVDEGHDVPSVDMHVTSDVPIGVGLSSSAALEVATLRAMRNLLALDIDDVRLAQLAHRAETRYTGVQCGILDQMACTLLNDRAMLFLDTRSLARSLLPLPAGSEILVIDSGIARTLASTRYNERRAECEEAARRLGVPALRDVDDLASVDMLPPPLRQRARHVVSENRRALRASRGIDAVEFGALMNESHNSLRDDFAVSIPALDNLVGLLRIDTDVYGAKLTGAGFGGACVALCREHSARRVALRVLEPDRTLTTQARVLVPPL